MVGINNITNVTLDQINKIGNSTSLSEFFIRIDQTVYGGIFWFIMLWVFWAIGFMAAQRFKDQPLNNAMYSGAVTSVLAILLRGIQLTIDGNLLSMITDWQMWIFPLITMVLAAIIWAIKE